MHICLRYLKFQELYTDPRTDPRTIKQNKATISLQISTIRFAEYYGTRLFYDYFIEIFLLFYNYFIRIFVLFFFLFFSVVYFYF